jgi:hypothetical protein
MSEPQPPFPQARFAAQARLIKTLSAIAQIGLMIALFVMWKHYGVPFGKAFEWCFVAGVTIYVALGTVASVLMTLARVHPVEMLLRQILGIVSFAIFAALHWVYGLGIMQSAGTWAAIYFGARLLVSRIERRAMQRFRIG